MNCVYKMKKFKSKIQLFRLFPTSKGWSIDINNYDGKYTQVRAVSLKQAYFMVKNNKWMEDKEDTGIEEEYDRDTKIKRCWNGK